MPKPETPLTEAATALEEELQRFERAAETIRTLSLDSGKHLEKAGKALRDVADLDERLGEKVQALVQAVAAVRDRQQVQAKSIHDRALVLQERTHAYHELLSRYEQLGRSAGALNGDVQQFAAERESATGEALNAKLEALQQRMGELAAEAESLANAATEKDFSDVARQADSLRQQLLAAKNKLGLLFR